MKTKLLSGNIVTLQSQDYITDNCWVHIKGSSFAERFSMHRYFIDGRRMLPIVAQTINELEGVPIITIDFK
jgi:uncharacterized membrane protein YcgQ (UPF0703/DUF1980 family)